MTGETGRWDPMTEAVLHFAARQEHVARFDDAGTSFSPPDIGVAMMRSRSPLACS